MVGLRYVLPFNLIFLCYICVSLGFASGGVLMPLPALPRQYVNIYRAPIITELLLKSLIHTEFLVTLGFFFQEVGLSCWNYWNITTHQRYQCKANHHYPLVLYPRELCYYISTCSHFVSFFFELINHLKNREYYEYWWKAYLLACLCWSRLK